MVPARLEPAHLPSPLGVCCPLRCRLSFGGLPLGRLSCVFLSPPALLRRRGFALLSQCLQPRLPQHAGASLAKGPSPLALTLDRHVR